MSESFYSNSEQAISDLLAVAWKFDDKPHQLFLAVSRIAQQYADQRDAPEIDRLMMRAYERIGDAPQVWSDDGAQQPQTPTTGVNAIMGTWSGNETDEELQRGLAELDGKGEFDPVEWGFRCVTPADMWTRGEEFGRHIIYSNSGNRMEVRYESKGGITMRYSGKWPADTTEGAILMELLGFEHTTGKELRPATPGTCRVCGCTDDDCRGCVDRTGGPCYWVDEQHTICSACIESPAEDGEEVAHNE